MSDQSSRQLGGSYVPPNQSQSFTLTGPNTLSVHKHRRPPAAKARKKTASKARVSVKFRSTASSQAKLTAKSPVKSRTSQSSNNALRVQQQRTQRIENQRRREEERKTAALSKHMYKRISEDVWNELDKQGRLQLLKTERDRVVLLKRHVETHQQARVQQWREQELRRRRAEESVVRVLESRYFELERKWFRDESNAPEMSLGFQNSTEVVSRTPLQASPSDSKLGASHDSDADRVIVEVPDTVRQELARVRLDSHGGRPSQDSDTVSSDTTKVVVVRGVTDSTQEPVIAPLSQLPPPPHMLADVDGVPGELTDGKAVVNPLGMSLFVRMTKGSAVMKLPRSGGTNARPTVIRLGYVIHPDCLKSEGFPSWESMCDRWDCVDGLSLRTKGGGESKESDNSSDVPLWTLVQHPCLQWFVQWESRRKRGNAARYYLSPPRCQCDKKDESKNSGDSDEHSDESGRNGPSGAVLLGWRTGNFRLYAEECARKWDNTVAEKSMSVLSWRTVQRVCTGGHQDGCSCLQDLVAGNESDSGISRRRRHLLRWSCHNLPPILRPLDVIMLTRKDLEVWVELMTVCGCPENIVVSAQ